MPTTPFIDKAKKIEALLQEALDLADGTGIISETFIAVITTARRNVMKRAHEVEDTKKERSK